MALAVECPIASKASIMVNCPRAAMWLPPIGLLFNFKFSFSHHTALYALFEIGEEISKKGIKKEKIEEQRIIKGFDFFYLFG